MATDCQKTAAFVIPRSSHKSRVLRWSQSSRVFIPITGITRAAPAAITTQGNHNLPKGWRIWVESVKGMAEVNRPFKPVDGFARLHYIADVLGDDQIQLRGINSLDFRAYTSGGVITYKPPQDLAGYTAALVLYDSLVTKNELARLTTDVDGGIVLDNVEKTISITTSPEMVEAYEFSSGEFALLMTDEDGYITQLAQGPFQVDP